MNITNKYFDNAAKLSLIGVFLAFPISLAMANIMMALTLLFWIAYGNFRRRWLDIHEHPLVLPALWMFAIVIIGVSYSIAPLELALKHVSKYSKFLFIPLTLSLLTQDTWRKHCLHAFYLAMLVTLLSTYAGIWWSVPWSVSKDNLGWGVDHTVFKDYIAQGLMVSVFFLMTAAEAIKARQLLHRWIWSLLAIFSAISILFLSNGRSGYVALLAGGGCFFWVIYSRPLAKLFVALTFVAIAFTSYFASPTVHERVNQGYEEVVNALARPINQSSENLTSLGARIGMWRVSVTGMLAHPVLGSGTGSYPVLARQAFYSQDILDMQGVHPHNQFLFFGVELGLVGLLSYVFYLFRAGITGRTMSAVDRATLFGFLAIMVSDSLFHGALWLSTESHLFTFVLALLSATGSFTRARK